MKKHLLSLLLCSTFVAATAQPVGTPVSSGPVITFASLEHDYGTIAQGADGNCEFTYTNSGDQPLIIAECQKSCGCTTPNCSHEPLAPGRSTLIQVHYDTNRVGPINKSVTVTSNAVNAPVTVLRIKGQVLASAVTAEPAPTMTKP